MEAIRAARVSVPEWVDPALGEVLLKALAPDPDNRYHTAGEFAGALLTWALDSGQSPPRSSVQSWLMKTLSYAGL
jgi:serine/threonine-protein kinase